MGESKGTRSVDITLTISRHAHAAWKIDGWCEARGITKSALITKAPVE